ncbi:MAG: hypothetical protein DUD34_08670 [Lactobacillus sp.]|nr:MAG: hypothetical protein DUD34_08670 [Lactobacillus sp.]
MSFFQKFQNDIANFILVANGCLAVLDAGFILMPHLQLVIIQTAQNFLCLDSSFIVDKIKNNEAQWLISFESLKI